MKFDEHFVKERTGHLDKNIKYGLRGVFFFCHLNFELVNCKHRPRIYARV